MRCHARIEFSGTALSGTYGAARQVLYVGWDLSGQVTLAAPNQPTLSYGFTDHRDPMESEIFSGPRPTAPRDALKAMS